MTDIITTTTVDAMRTADIARIAADLSYGYLPETDMTLADNRLSGLARVYGILPSYGDSWTPAANRDDYGKAMSGVRETRDAYARTYQWTRTDRTRVNDRLYRLAYGRMTAVPDIMSAVSAVHPVLAWLLTDIVIVDRTGEYRVPVGPDRTLVLQWYMGALEVAYLS